MKASIIGRTLAVLNGVFLLKSMPCREKSVERGNSTVNNALEKENRKEIEKSLFLCNKSPYETIKNSYYTIKEVSYMIIIFLLIIPSLYILIKLILCFIVSKFGKFSYDGFSAAGFSYDAKRDIFYSTRNAWQKNFGYSHMYDVYAPLFQMIIDTEPIRFNYNDKNWLITFWKGQYGIVTGAEVGIYCTNDREVNKKTVYLPAKDNEMLNMSFILYRKGKVITTVKAKHWWLAVFKLGMFSNPKDLAMDITITFPNKEMLSAFLCSFEKLGYKYKDYKIINNTFCFKYNKPHTHKVWTRNCIIDAIRQLFNHQNVKLYNHFLADMIDNNKIDDSRNNDNHLIMVNDLIPNILKNKNSKSHMNKEIPVKNIVYLNSNVYSNVKGISHDKEIR